MLIICPTPIGNLDDVSPRQMEVLRSADVIACEDTRTTGKLLELLDIERIDGRPALVSYHEHNARERADELLDDLLTGRTVVLVSDAGTPTISDPGYRLVHAATEAGVEVTALPGPVAGIVALSASGLPTDRFLFEGFLPAKSKARTDRLEILRATGITIVVYESPHRIVRAIDDIMEVYGEAHHICVGRELTKMHEEYVRGTARDVRDTLDARPNLRGEFVMVLAPADEELLRPMLDEDALADRIRQRLDEGAYTKQIRDELSEHTPMPSSELYEFIEAIKREGSAT